MPAAVRASGFTTAPSRGCRWQPECARSRVRECWWPTAASERPITERGAPVPDDRPRVLIIDDETGYAEDLAALVSDDLRCDVSGTPEDAMRAVERVAYDLVFLDIDLQHEIDGIALLARLKEFDPALPVVMLTKTSDVADIVESMKRGAFYYVVKGEDLSVHDLVHVARLAVDDARMRRSVSAIEEEERGALDAIVGSSSATRRLKEEIARVAPLDCSVLVIGESGTGKELVARALHATSGRASKGRFVAVNCAAFPEQLIESELFGHEKGAFTGAERRRTGKFEYAAHGTILLDEIGDMSDAGQAKLLRVLEERSFERVGGNQMVETDARVIASTNQDLEKLMPAGRFREDLYHRLAEYVIEVPPLRDRPGDIPEIAVHLVGELARQVGRRGIGVSEQALEALRRREWRRNNVRELRNVLLAALVRCDEDTVRPRHLFRDRYEAADTPPTYETAKQEAVEGFKRRYLTWLLGLTNGNVAAAAEIAGIQRTTFHRHLSEVGLDAEDFRKQRRDG
ncbi:MAG: response regulator [Candidatus Eisenbacteria bacterium]|nr:response regulator [Candidatus Eisenbacteria bacterium]